MEVWLGVAGDSLNAFYLAMLSFRFYSFVCLVMVGGVLIDLDVCSGGLYRSYHWISTYPCVWFNPVELLSSLAIYHTFCPISMVCIVCLRCGSGCFSGVMGMGWCGDIREVLVDSMIMIEFFLLVMEYKVAPLLHTLAPCISYIINHDHGLDFGVLLIVQEVCTGFCCHGRIRGAFQTFLDLLIHFCVVFAGPSFVLLSLFIIMGHLGLGWAGDIRVVLVVAADKTVVFFYYRGCMVALLLHTLSLCIPLFSGFICGLGWGSYVVLMQEVCMFGVCHGGKRKDNLADLFFNFFFLKIDPSFVLLNLWLLVVHGGLINRFRKLICGFCVCCCQYMEFFRVAAVVCYSCCLRFCCPIHSNDVRLQNVEVMMLYLLENGVADGIFYYKSYWFLLTVWVRDGLAVATVMVYFMYIGASSKLQQKGKAFSCCLWYNRNLLQLFVDVCCCHWFGSCCCDRIVKQQLFCIMKLQIIFVLKAICKLLKWSSSCWSFVDLGVVSGYSCYVVFRMGQAMFAACIFTAKLTVLRSVCVYCCHILTWCINEFLWWLNGLLLLICLLLLIWLVLVLMLFEVCLGFIRMHYGGCSCFKIYSHQLLSWFGQKDGLGSVYDAAAATGLCASVGIMFNPWFAVIMQLVVVIWDWDLIGHTCCWYLYLLPVALYVTVCCWLWLQFGVECEMQQNEFCWFAVFWVCYMMFTVEGCCCCYGCCGFMQPVENHGCHYGAADLCYSLCVISGISKQFDNLQQWWSKCFMQQKGLAVFYFCCCCWGAQLLVHSFLLLLQKGQTVEMVFRPLCLVNTAADMICGYFIRASSVPVAACFCYYWEDTQGQQFSFLVDGKYLIAMHSCCCCSVVLLCCCYCCNISSIAVLGILAYCCCCMCYYCCCCLVGHLGYIEDMDYDDIQGDACKSQQVGCFLQVKEQSLEDVHGGIQYLFLRLYRFYNTWFNYKFKFVSCQVLGFIVVLLFLALFPKHILGSQLG